MLLSNSSPKYNKYKKYLESGKNIVENNPFYYTLNCLIKYYFVQQHDLHLITFIKDVTNSENEFKVFMIFKEFAIYIYQTKLQDELPRINTVKDIDDTVYTIIGYTKSLYDEDRSVITPFINSLNEHEKDVIAKFNSIKSTYNFKVNAKAK